MALPATQLPAPEIGAEASALLVNAHRRAMEAAPAEMAAFFQRLLGQKWTAYMTGVSDPKAVGKWARDERTPRDESLRKLRDAYQIAQLIAQADDVETAGAWFLGMNPYLDHRAPVWVIATHENGGERAMDAALAYISYG